MNTTPLSPETLENAFFKNLHNQPAAEELHLIHHKSGPPSPDGGGADIFLDHSGSTYIIPKLSLYSTGLMPPKVILIRSSLYQ